MSESSILTLPIPDLDTLSFSVVFDDGFVNQKPFILHPPHSFKNPFDLDLSQFIPNQPIKLEGLVDLFGRIIADAEIRAEVPEGKRVNYTQEYQPDAFAELGTSTGKETITFKVLNRTPAKMSHDGKSRPNRLPRFSYEYANAAEPNKILYIESRPIDHRIELCVWAKTATLANQRALWLERLLISHRWAITSMGVKPFYWEDRGPDTVWVSSGTRLHQRPLKFFARLQEYSITAYPTIRELSTQLTIAE